MTQSLETRIGEHGLEYHHEQLGHIATKIVGASLCSLVAVEGPPKQIAARLFGNPYGTAGGIGWETADWLALALAAELVAEQQQQAAA